MIRAIRWCVAASLAVGALLLICPAPALGFNDGGSTDPSITDCYFCHRNRPPGGSEPEYVSGPHGYYDSTTDACAACHFVHDAPGAMSLLWRDTIKDNCLTCHDGTGGKGVYGTIAARGLTVGAGHSVEDTCAVPGGDEVTGGEKAYDFNGADAGNGSMSCDDCHSPHHSAVVNDFWGDRDRGSMDVWERSDKLLRSRPNSVDTTIPEYGSDWCAACHKGRSSGGLVHNHPVDSTVVTSSPFYYDRVARVTSELSLETTLGTMGRSNFGYVMPYPRTAGQQGHKPICQQCHEDSRVVGEPGAAVAYVKDEDDGFDNSLPTDNPRFEGFPHETVNRRFLVELDDNLCLNCHPVSQLP